MDKLRKVSGVLCDTKVSAKVKGKKYKSVVRPAMLYGMETVTVTERQVGKNGSCRFENDEMGTGSDKKGQDKKWKRKRDRENARLCWNGHVKRRGKGYEGKRMMEIAVPGRRKRRRLRRRWIDLAREYMERVGAREGDEIDWVRWRILSHCGNPE